jgi:hypothetical protein
MQMTENVENILEFIHKDCHRTILELTDTDWISYGVYQIVTENVNMHDTATKFVTRLLTNDQSLLLTATW